jgi:Major Facilitator Superfamily.
MDYLFYWLYRRIIGDNEFGEYLASTSRVRTNKVFRNHYRGTIFADFGAGNAGGDGGFHLQQLGRIAWGRISDKNGREKTLAAVFALCGVMLLVLGGLNSFWSFVVAASAIGFCFGGFLALYPAITADYFGSKNIGANYGLMFSAYGAGGLLGPWLAPKLMSAAQNVPHQTAAANGQIIVKLFETGSYSTSFFLAAILCFVAVFLVLRLKTKSF